MLQKNGKRIVKVKKYKGLQNVHENTRINTHKYKYSITDIYKYLYRRIHVKI